MAKGEEALADVDFSLVIFDICTAQIWPRKRRQTGNYSFANIAAVCGVGHFLVHCAGSF